MLKFGDLVDGKYEVVRLLDEGGMGAVYEGRNVRINRRVSIKVMHASLAHDREFVARFDREAKASAKICSRHLADVLDLGDLPNGDRFMIMEFLDGESLAARLKRRARLPPNEIAPVAIQILEGLAKINDAGFLHRDLKPANIFLVRADGTDFVKILDLGICKFLGEPGEVQTEIGNLMGTLSYMAPEHLEHGAKNLDARADLYSVGVILYRCVSGRVPYRGKNHVEQLLELRAGRADPIRDVVPELDAGFAEIIERALEWDPAARYPTARAFRSALVAWRDAREQVHSILTDFLDAAKHEGPPLLSTPPRASSTSTLQAAGPLPSVAVPREDAVDDDPGLLIDVTLEGLEEDPDAVNTRKVRPR